MKRERGTLSDRERDWQRPVGGLRNGFDEWVRRSGGFVVVGLRNGFSGFRVEFEQEKMEGTTKPVLWALLDKRARSWVGQGRDRFWVDRSWVVTI